MEIVLYGHTNSYPYLCGSIHIGDRSVISIPKTKALCCYKFRVCLRISYFDSYLPTFIIDGRNPPYVYNILHANTLILSILYLYVLSHPLYV